MQSITKTTIEGAYKELTLNVLKYGQNTKCPAGDSIRLASNLISHIKHPERIDDSVGIFDQTGYIRENIQDFFDDFIFKNERVVAYPSELHTTNQIEDAIAQLKKFKLNKSVGISTAIPFIDNCLENPFGLVYVDFKIRKDPYDTKERLHVTALWRREDVFLEYFPQTLAIHMLQKKIGREVGIPPGTITTHIAEGYILEKDIRKAKTYTRFQGW